MADLDYAALFEATPSPYLVLGPDLVIVEVNRAYLEATCRTRQDLLGRHIFDAFPDNAADPKADGVRNLKASLHRVLLSQEPDTMALQKYDIPIMGRPGVFEERWWSPINTPILGPAGTVEWIIHRVEDVTAFVQSRASSGRLPTGQMTEREALEAELFARARELQHLNEELRMAHARERQVAVTLQEAMLQSPDLDRHDNVAVRYLPATGSLNVCGDWYDMVDLTDGRFAVAVGDVVGHGLKAAAVMGMLRSALSAAIRALERPAQALDVLGVYARSVEDALNTTVIKAMVDPRSRLITYSNSGHPPPILVHRDGKYELLDQALDPPLGSRSQFAPCSQAGRSYTPGDTLVLYTDGLFERRGEDIDAGLGRLGEVLGRYVIHSPERLADEVLDGLGVAGGARDDIALIIVQLLPLAKTEPCRRQGLRITVEPASKAPLSRNCCGRRPRQPPDSVVSPVGPNAKSKTHRPLGRACILAGRHCGVADPNDSTAPSSGESPGHEKGHIARTFAVHFPTAYLNPPPQVTALVSRLAALLAAPPAKLAVPGPAVTRLDDSNRAVVAGPTRPWRLYDRLTSEDIETIVRAHAAGTIQKDLAIRFDISVSSVQRLLRERGEGRRSDVRASIQYGGEQTQAKPAADRTDRGAR